MKNISITFVAFIVVIMASSCGSDNPLLTDFTYSSASFIPPSTIQFSNLTEGKNLEYVWDFGDGTFSTEQNPSHIFKDAGKYEVRLTANNGKSQGEQTRTVDIQSNSRKPIASFDYSPSQNLKAPVEVAFHNTSLGDSTEFLFEYGNGQTDNKYSISNYCYTVYSQPGTYTISLLVRNKYGTSTATKSIVIE